MYEKDSVLYDASLIGRSCLLSISFSGVDVNSRSLRENESDIKPQNSDQRRTTCFASLLMKFRRMLRDMMLKRGYKDSKYTYEIRVMNCRKYVNNRLFSFQINYDLETFENMSIYWVNRTSK